MKTNNHIPWSGRMVWDGRALMHTDDWVFELDSIEIDQLRSSVHASINSTKPWAEQTCADYELANLGDRLLELRKEVLDGRGFALIRGLSKTD